MPTYSYECRKCGHRFEEILTFREYGEKKVKCPKCGSHDTGNCGNDPEINDLMVGRCYDCGQLFCTECGRLLEPQSASCDCWDDDGSATLDSTGS